MTDQKGVYFEGGKPPNRYTTASIEAISIAYARIAEAFASAVARVGTAPHSISIAECNFDMATKKEEQND